MYELATMCYYGLQSLDGEPKRNYSEACRLFRELSETDSEFKPHAESMIGRMYYRGVVPREGQSFEKAYEHLRSSEGANSANVSMLAWMESQGLGRRFNFAEAEASYLSVAESNPHARFNLGELYRKYGKFHKA